jgi:hypothetical protein
MKPGMDRARQSFEELLEADATTAGLIVRVQGENLIVARDIETDSGEVVSDDRVRLTRLSTARWGLSVKRHTGRWQRTPFTGKLDEIVDAIQGFMQHLVAPY